MLGFFDDENPSSLSATVPVPHASEFELLFSSPTTDIDDGSLRTSVHPVPLHSPNQTLSNRQEVAAQIDSLLASPDHTNPIPSPLPFVDPLYTQHPIPIARTKVEPELHAASTILSNAASNPTDVLCSNSFISTEPANPRVGKKRSLSVMQNLATKNAPNASLSDDELLKIGTMFESEQDLAESKELYHSLITFKQCLSKYGYRMTALYIDSVSPPHAADVDQPPFAFILNKKSHNAMSSAAKSAFTSGAGDTAQEPSLNQPSSATQSSSETSLRRNDPTASTQRPRKRSRVSHNGESNSHGRRFSCVVCCKKMADITNLVRHFRHTHQELKPFQCPKCGGHYSSEGTLWHHISNVHSDSPRTHKCEYCDASYDSCGAKTRHVHGTHHTEKPLYPCPFKDCKRVFVYPAHLEVHAQEDHDGFRPFQCEECSKSFSSSNGLVRHCREVHRREKAYTCPVCHTGLTKRCHLKRHLLNVHHMDVKAVDEEMKKHPNPADIPSVVQPRFVV